MSETTDNPFVGPYVGETAQAPTPAPAPAVPARRPGPQGVPLADPAAILAKAADARASEQEIALSIAREPLLRRSESIGKLAAALAKAQGEITNAAKSADNPFFKSKYADLGSIMDACRGPLSKYGIAYLQPASSIGKTVIVTTLVAFEDEWIEDKLILTAAQDSPQAVGSAITYGRRYALAAMIGVAAGDDDGNAASGSETMTGVKRDAATGKLQQEPQAIRQGGLVGDPHAAPTLQPATPPPAARPQVAPEDRPKVARPAAVGTAGTSTPPPPGMRPPARVPGS